MMMPGEVKILLYLRQHSGATVADVARTCLPGTPQGSVHRIISNLDWLGYVAIYPGPGGTAAVLQITEKGMAATGGQVVVASR